MDTLDAQLKIAVLHSRKEEVRRLIALGAKDSLTNPGSTEMSALHTAVTQGEPEIAEMLLINGSDPNAPGGFRNISDSPLLQALRMKHWALVVTLVKYKADLEYRDSSGYTPLMLAIRHGGLRFARLLVEAGANPCAKSDYRLTDSTGATHVVTESLSALHEAITQVNVEAVRYLLAFKVDLEHGNEFVQSPLCSAICHESVEVAQVLLDAGAEVNAPTQPYSSSPLMVAIANNIPGLSEMIDLLIAHGASLNQKNDLGDTALDIAKKQGNHAAIAALEFHQLAPRNHENERMASDNPRRRI